MSRPSRVDVSSAFTLSRCWLQPWPSDCRHCGSTVRGAAVARCDCPAAGWLHWPMCPRPVYKDWRLHHPGRCLSVAQCNHHLSRDRGVPLTPQSGPPALAHLPPGAQLAKPSLLTALSQHQRHPACVASSASTVHASSIGIVNSRSATVDVRTGTVRERTRTYTIHTGSTVLPTFYLFTHHSEADFHCKLVPAHSRAGTVLVPVLRAVLVPGNLVSTRVLVHCIVYPGWCSLALCPVSESARKPMRLRRTGRLQTTLSPPSCRMAASGRGAAHCA